MAMKGVVPSVVRALPEAEQAFLFAAFVWTIEQEQKELEQAEKRKVEKPAK